MAEQLQGGSPLKNQRFMQPLPGQSTEEKPTENNQMGPRSPINTQNSNMRYPEAAQVMEIQVKLKMQANENEPNNVVTTD